MKNKKEIFRYFMSTCFSPVFEDTDLEEIDELGEEFHSYLDNELNDKQKERKAPPGHRPGGA